MTTDKEIIQDSLIFDPDPIVKYPRAVPRARTGTNEDIMIQMLLQWFYRLGRVSNGVDWAFTRRRGR